MAESTSLKPNGTQVRSRRRKGSLLGEEEPRGGSAAPSVGSALHAASSPNAITAPRPAWAQTSNNSATAKAKSRARRRAAPDANASLFERWRYLSFKYTWLNPLIICIGVLLAYAVNPSPSNPVHPALIPSYPVAAPLSSKLNPFSEPTQYEIGGLDFVFVGFYMVFFTFTRELIMQAVLRPCAIRAGILTRGKQARFMEQAYTGIYFAVFGPFGLYVMRHSGIWFFNLEAVYTGFPHKTHSLVFKTYYLLQAAYWAQQAGVLMLLLEKPRKDFKELVAHHIITIALIWLSYAFHFTRVGIIVYITHDVSDFFLATSKVLHYLDSAAVIPYFMILMGTWIYMRHFQNLRILFSMLPLASPLPAAVDEQLHSTVSSAYSAAQPALRPLISAATSVLPASTTAQLSHFFTSALPHWWNTPSMFESIGPFELNWATQQYKCWISQWITFALLASLQAVNILWLYFLFRTLWRVAISLGADKVDERSMDDSDDERVDDDDLPPASFVDTGRSAADTLRPHSE